MGSLEELLNWMSVIVNPADHVRGGAVLVEYVDMEKKTEEHNKKTNIEQIALFIINHLRVFSDK